jgi:hypothetical protein
MVREIAVRDFPLSVYWCSAHSHFMLEMRSYNPRIIRDKFSHRNKSIAKFLGLALFQTLRIK